MLEPDYYTTSVAMNIGLQTKQDVVVAGSFNISTKTGTQTVETHIIIVDVARKKVVSDFNISGPADNRIFESVDKLAQRISEEIKPLLPSKGEWKKTGYQVSNASLIEDFRIGARLGVDFIVAAGLIN